LILLYVLFTFIIIPSIGNLKIFEVSAFHVLFCFPIFYIFRFLWLSTIYSSCYSCLGNQNT